MSRVLKDVNGIPLPFFRQGDTQVVDIANVAAATTAYTETCAVRILVSIDAHINISAENNADTTSMLMIAGIPEFFIVEPSNLVSVVAFDAEDTGKMYVTVLR